MKIQINGKTLTKKGLVTIALATTIAINTLAFGAYKVVDTVVDTATTTTAVESVEVQVAYGTEHSTVWSAISNVNPDIKGTDMEYAMSLVHQLNGTDKYIGWEDNMPAGTYLIPVIK